MSSPLLHDALAKAGVDETAVGKPQSFPLSWLSVDEARGPGVRLEAPLHVRSDVLHHIGVRATYDPATQRMTFSARDTLPIAIEPGAAGGDTTAAGEQSVPTDGHREFVIASPEGVPLASCRFDTGRAEFALVEAWPRPPLADWHAAAGDAEWTLLAREEVLRGGVLSRWQAVVIAGRLARVFRPADADAALQAMLTGARASSPADAMTQARTWPRTLTPLQRSAIERAAVVVAHGMAYSLSQHLEASDLVRPAEYEMDLSMRVLFCDRDDLEGIRVLLREADADAGAALAAALDEVDAIGRALRFSWPTEVDVHEERLQRVSEADPTAWWGSTRYRVPVF
jgi:hypothetical protein